MKRVLILAYYFPPLGMGGVQRVAKWVKFLPRFGWAPHILTVQPIRYHAFDASLLAEVDGIPVTRTESLDPARLAKRFFPRSENAAVPAQSVSSSGRLQKWLRFLLLPDSKIGWYPIAVRTARRLIDTLQPEAIISTSPPLTAHLVALHIKKSFGLPWVADFRDGWLGGEYVPTPTALHRFFHRRWARQVLKQADTVLAVSEPILKSLEAFSPQTPEKFQELPNGFDSEDFAGLVPRKFEKPTLLYAGSVGGANDPQFFFEGMKILAKTDPNLLDKWQVLFLGQVLESISVPREIQKWVRFKPYTPHRESLSAVLGAEGLLFFLSPRVKEGMVTGKIFEYVASGRPVFAVLPEATAAAHILKKYAFGKVVTRPEASAVARELRAFLRGEFPLRSDEKWQALRALYSRKNQTETLAKILEESVQS